MSLHDHHHLRCGNFGCNAVLEQELFAEQRLIAAEEFSCLNCGGGYVNPADRLGYDAYLAASGATDVALGAAIGGPLGAALEAEGFAEEAEAAVDAVLDFL